MISRAESPTGSPAGSSTGSIPVLSTLLPGFAGRTLPTWLRDRLRSGLGGVCLFGPNIESPRQLRGLTEAIYAENPRAIIAVDEEGGDVTRLFTDAGSPSPGNAVLGRIDDPDTTAHAAAQIGRQLRRAGVNVNFAPSVDINSRSDNPVIGVRSFGATADRVARHSAAWVTGLQSTGVAASAKHFPGHGDTARDSHLTLPVVDRSLDELRRRELVPFAAAIAAGSRLVMTSHILLPQVDTANPATMSPRILGDLLRGELGFSGVIVSDALDMAGARSVGGGAEACARALGAGCDLLCLGTENSDRELDQIERAVSAAVAAGALRADRVRDAARRVRALSDDLAALRRSVPAPSESAPDGDWAGGDWAGGDWAGGDWAGGDREVIRCFDISPATSSWHTRTAGSYAVVRLDTAPNRAAGPTPWGPFAAVAHDPPRPAATAFAARPQFSVTEPGSTSRAPIPGGPVLVVGRDIHRHAFAREAVDRLRREHADVLVVDMGWPSEDRRYADIATFGASRLVGRALLTYLVGGAPGVRTV